LYSCKFNLGNLVATSKSLHLLPLKYKWIKSDILHEYYNNVKVKGCIPPNINYNTFIDNIQRVSEINKYVFIDKRQIGEKKAVYVLILGKKKGNVDIYNNYSIYNSDLSGLLFMPVTPITTAKSIDTTTTTSTAAVSQQLITANHLMIDPTLVPTKKWGQISTVTPPPTTTTVVSQQSMKAHHSMIDSIIGPTKKRGQASTNKTNNMDPLNLLYEIALASSPTRSDIANINNKSNNNQLNPIPNQIQYITNKSSNPIQYITNKSSNPIQSPTNKSSNPIQSPTNIPSSYQTFLIFYPILICKIDQDFILLPCHPSL
jgi:hypothetical protein